MELGYFIMVAEIIRWKDLWHQPSESPAFFFILLFHFGQDYSKNFQTGSSCIHLRCTLFKDCGDTNVAQPIKQVVTSLDKIQHNVGVPKATYVRMNLSTLKSRLKKLRKIHIL
jgi:hypothetical protein